MKTFSQSINVRAATLAAIIAAACAGTGQARAAEIRVLSAAAMQSIFKVIAADFERTSGHKLAFAYTTMGAITERVLAGEAADVIIGSTQSMERLARERKIDAGSRVTIAKVGVGAVVPTGTAKPSIGSPDELKRALVTATTIVYADPAGGGAAGIHIARVIDKLGISDQLKTKTTFGAGGDVTEVTLAQGAGTLGMTQISEIVDKVGAEFVGPFPDELQNYTGVTVGIPAGVTPSEAVAAFVRFLTSRGAVAAIEAKGMQVE